MASSTPTISGSLIIASGVSGPVNLDGIENILGDLRCQNSGGVTSVSAKNFVNIAGMMQMNNMAALSSLSFPALESMDKILWNELPVLSEAAFYRDVKNVGLVLKERGYQTLTG